MPTVPSTRARWGRNTDDMSAMATSIGLAVSSLIGGSMCSSTLLRRHRQPFMFLIARVTPVCMCIFITGIETTRSKSNTSWQTRT